MPSFSAKSRTSPDSPKSVVFVVYPDIVLLDLSGPLQVFTHALDHKTGVNGYDCAVASLDGGMIQTNTVVGIPSAPITKFMDHPIHTLVVVGGAGANTAMRNRTLLDKIQKLSTDTQRICSVCSGALILAAAGILDGRKAVTHWEDCKTLAEEFPNVRVEIDPIYVKDGHVWTSAGITAGIDMALAIVAEDLGRPAALQMARSMVTHMVRSGGQSQFSPVLDRQSLDANSRFEDLHQWITENPQIDLRVDVLAERMNMSARNFSRLYSGQMGTTPAKTVEAIRTDTARDLLETTDLSMKQIAAQCGFKDEERLRRTFLRLLNISPSAYRQGFQTADVGILPVPDT